MIINFSKGFLFVHIPKTAGTSVSAALGRLTTYRDIEIGGTRYGEAIQDIYRARFGLFKHSLGHDVKATIGADWGPLYKFCFVRDPYARAVSLYHFLLAWHEGPNHKAVKKLSFQKFLDSELVRAPLIQIAKPQWHWISADGTSEGEPLDIQFIGRHERVEEDLKRIVARVTAVAEPDLSLARLNSSKTASRDLKSTLSAGEIASIRQVYEVDFDRLGYARDL